MNLREIVLANDSYRIIIDSTAELQVVAMCLYPGEEVAWEKHSQNSQFIRVEDGVLNVQIENQRYTLSKDDYVIVPSGNQHRLWNSQFTLVKFYSIYAPPEQDDHETEST